MALDPDIPETRRHARNLLAGYVGVLGCEAEQVYEGAGAALLNVAVSPDGRLLAAAGERGTLVLFEADSGRLLRRLEGHDPRAGQAGAVYAVLFSADGGLLYSAGEDGRILRWALPEGERVGEPWQAPGEVWTLALSPDGTTLASGGSDDAITLWSTADGARLRTLTGKSSSIASENALSFTPDGRLVSGGRNGEVGLWDPADGREQPLQRVHTDDVDAVAVSPDGRYLASGGDDRHIVLWRLGPKGAEPLRRLPGHTNQVQGLRFAPGERLLSASHDNTLRLWDLASGATLHLYQGQSGLNSIALHGGAVYTAANDATLRRWSLATPGQWLWGLASEPASAAIAPDGRAVAVGFADGALRLYPLPGTPVDLSKPLAEVADAHGKDVQRLAFSPDGTLLATASLDHTARLWRLDPTPAGPALTPLHTLRGHTDAVHAVAFSPDGRILASAGYDGRVGLFQVGSGTGELFEAHEGKVAGVAFDSSGGYLLSTGNEDLRLRLWDLGQTPPRPRDLACAPGNLLWSTLRHDARQLAAVGREAVVTLIDLGPALDPTPPRHLVGHENTVYRAIYTPDGAQLATVGGDMTLRLWDLERNQPLFTLRLPTEDICPSPLWDLALHCLPPDASGPDAGHCWIAVPLTMGRLALYRLPYHQPPADLGP